MPYRGTRKSYEIGFASLFLQAVPWVSFEPFNFVADILITVLNAKARCLPYLIACSEVTHSK